MCESTKQPKVSVIHFRCHQPKQAASKHLLFHTITGMEAAGNFQYAIVVFLTEIMIKAWRVEFLHNVLQGLFVCLGAAKMENMTQVYLHIQVWPSNMILRKNREA